MTDYALMNHLLYIGEADAVREMTEKALEEGLDVDDILQKGLIAGMSVVGEDFKHNRLYVPQVLIAARAMTVPASFNRSRDSSLDHREETMLATGRSASGKGPGAFGSCLISGSPPSQAARSMANAIAVMPPLCQHPPGRLRNGREACEMVHAGTGPT